MTNQSNTQWNKSEKEKLQQIYIHTSWDILLKTFPQRSQCSIRAQAKRLGLHKKHTYESFDFINQEIINQLNETDKAYIAGFFDGEGCINIHKGKIYGKSINPHHRLVIRLANTNKEIVDYFYNLFRGYKRTNYNLRGNERICFYWSLASQKAANFLKLMLPYFRLKQEQAAVAIEFQSRFAYTGKPVSLAELEIRDGYAKKLSILK